MTGDDHLILTRFAGDYDFVVTAAAVSARFLCGVTINSAAGAGGGTDDDALDVVAAVAWRPAISLQGEWQASVSGVIIILHKQHLKV
jgi:hypothetical protein